MSETAYVVAFPNDFSKNKIPQLITNIKKILTIKNLQFTSVKRDGDVILVDANDPVFSSSAISLLFGIDKVAITRNTKNSFEDIVSEISIVGGNLLLRGEKFLIRVEGITRGFFAKDVELAATSAIIEKKSNIEAKPGTEENYDKMIYTYLTKNNAYVCIFLDKGQGGIPYQSQDQTAICSLYDEISAVSCFETIKQGFDSKIIICYRQKSELMNLVKIVNQILPRLVTKEIDLEFFQVKNSGSGVNQHMSFLSNVVELMIRLAKQDKIQHVSIAASYQMFAGKFVDLAMKQVFENKLIPVIPLSGVGDNLFEDAKEIGLERNIPKIKKIISRNYKELPNFSNKIVDDAIKSKQTVKVVVGPNNIHDILDSIDH